MATLTATITEALTLNGKDRGSTNTLTLTGINDVYHRIVTCPASADTTIASFRTALSGVRSFVDIENAKYIRVTNLDGTNSINLSLQVSLAESSTADASASILIEAGKSFIMGSPHDGISVSDTNANIVTSLNDLESLLVDPSSNTVQVEVFIATT
jgi:hypothetical protein